MEYIVNNPYNLLEDEIELYEKRVKVLPINSMDELLLCRINGIYHFIGGHPEDGESFEECARREVFEEAGLELDFNGITPFYTLVEYQPNYFGTGKNGKSVIKYVQIYTDMKADISKMHLDENEIKQKFEFEYIPLEKVVEVLESTRELASDRGKIFLIDEMKSVIDIFFQTREKILVKR